MATQPPKTACPLTETKRNLSLDSLHGLRFYRDDTIGNWAVSEDLYRKDFRSPEYAPARAMVASKALRHRLEGTGQQPCVVSKSTRTQWSNSREHEARVADLNLEVCTIEELQSLALQMTLEQKALQTLKTLRLLEASPGAGLKIPVNLKNYPGSVDWNSENPLSPIGIAYACVRTEVPIVFQILKEDRLIQHGISQDDGIRIHITPQGYKVADRTPNHATRIFVVCRFDDDTAYLEVFKPVCESKKIDCPAVRVKDIPHNDRIDDRIMQEIRNSALVIVDITRANFNVGFEAGFALASNLPIVWCCLRTEKNDPSWAATFDIHGHNILLYDFDPPDHKAFKDALESQIMTALNRW
ncbi:MAG: hypothetical protein P4L46_25550 [Fimbriimonas sp.]|nr:hypothetical protein [Fimbriimonas sp.]